MKVGDKLICKKTFSGHISNNWLKIGKVYEIVAEDKKDIDFYIQSDGPMMSYFHNKEYFYTEKEIRLLKLK
ncbi:hypothetical protein M0Q50_05415, partial [bacterium]|nr:hypothetical protein [bacterium]